MNNIIDFTYGFALKDLGEQKNLLAMGDDFEPVVLDLQGICKKISIYSTEQQARLKMRKKFKDENIQYLSFLDKNCGENEICLFNSHDAEKYLELFGDKVNACGAVLIPYFQLGESLQEKIGQLKKVFSEVVGYTMEVKNRYVTLSKKAEDIACGDTGFVVLSNDEAMMKNLKNEYHYIDVVVDDSLKNKIKVQEQKIEKQEATINYLLIEHGRVSSGRYQFFGPLRAVKKLIVKVFGKIPVARHLLQFLSIARHQGFKVAMARVNGFFETKKFQSEYENQLVFRQEEYIPFDSEYQENMDFTGMTTDVKMLAFYLPQFHSFKENDEWWGKGFTEWNNTTVCTPRFEGHYQPRTPHKDLGYYDLSNIETLRHQAELAKQHGIYGFCFYYYWFSGKRLMEKPVDMLLEHPEIDLPFCLCWANENWTRAWDGQNRNVLIAQDYSEEDDLRFMADLKKYIDDKRYIHIDGKPLVMVYNPGEIPNCQKSFAMWRKQAKELGLGEILIWTCQTANNTAESLHIEDCIDAEVEFPPHNTWLSDFAMRDVDLSGKEATIINYQKLVSGWTQIAQKTKDVKPKKPLHHACMMAWDNAARRKNNWFTYNCFSLKSLYKWVLLIADQARRDFKESERFVFVNAWNEWAEGTYLEPDEKYGYANINTVSKALFNLPFKDDLRILTSEDRPLTSEEQHFKIAIQIHMFYTETIEEIISNLNLLPFDFDCYISTDTEEKAEVIRKAFESDCHCKKAVVELFENRGRDVAPFIVQMKKYIDEYDYICHIHSKKTVTGTYGDDWRKYIFKHMFGNSDYLSRMFRLFEQDSNLGLVFPETFPPLEYQAIWGGNLDGVERLLKKMDIMTTLPQNPVFPVGNMFWARAEAIRPLVTLGLTQESFAPEAGQTNLTLAHCIERCWIYLAQEYGFKYLKVYNYCDNVPIPEQDRIAFYVHYNKDGALAEEDIKSLEAYEQVFKKIIFVSNSPLDDADITKVQKITKDIYFRENEGFDFAAWKYGMEQFGYDNLKDYDQVAIINNSTLAPAIHLGSMFVEMKKRNDDFWGVTLFPFLADGSYLGMKTIPEHLQSYFIVFNKKVIESGEIQTFFENLQPANSYKEAIKNGEVKLTDYLRSKGFTYSPYLWETKYIHEYLGSASIPYDKPNSLLLLGSPFVKKKAYDYMSPYEKHKLELTMKKFS